MTSSSKLLILGLLSALFFSFTFLINRAISLDAGHWFYSGFLRYFFTILFISILLISFKGFSYFKRVLKEFVSNIVFWLISGTIGFGIFYSLICFAADYSPAWIVATSWQITIIASLIILFFFGKKLSFLTWVFTIIVFIGITIVNISHFELSNIKALLFGFIPVLIAAFAFPLGNQLVWEEKEKRAKNNNNIDILNNAFAKVLLLCLGSTPLWLILYFILDVSSPSSSQVINVAYISLFSGVIASSLFLYARSKANSAKKLILVDATQSGEVFFSLGAEVIFLGALIPSLFGFLGIFITLFGLMLLAFFDKN